MSTEANIIKKIDSEVMGLRKAGFTLPEIAKRLDMTDEAVHNSLTRELAVYSRKTPFAAVDYMKLMLERYEELFREVWPLCHHRKIEGPDGEDIVVPPDEKMIQTTLKIMDKMNNMVGLSPNNIETMMAASYRNESHDVKASLAGTGPLNKELESETAAKDWSLNILDLMTEAGILDTETMSEIRKAVSEAEREDSEGENDAGE